MSNEFESLSMVFWGVVGYLGLNQVIITPMIIENFMNIMCNSIPFILFVSFSIAWWFDG